MVPILPPTSVVYPLHLTVEYDDFTTFVTMHIVWLQAHLNYYYNYPSCTCLHTHIRCIGPNQTREGFFQDYTTQSFNQGCLRD